MRQRFPVFIGKEQQDGMPRPAQKIVPEENPRMAATLVKVLIHVVFSTKKRVPFSLTNLP